MSLCEFMLSQCLLDVNAAHEVFVCVCVLEDHQRPAAVRRIKKKVSW